MHYSEDIEGSDRREHFTFRIFYEYQAIRYDTNRRGYEYTHRDYYVVHVYSDGEYTAFAPPVQSRD